MSRATTNELTQRELEVMHVFWTHGDLTAAARDHLADSGRELTYTTVATLVRLLFDKGFLRALNDERPFVYAPTRSHEEVPWRASSATYPPRIQGLTGAIAASPFRATSTQRQRARVSASDSQGESVMTALGVQMVWLAVRVTGIGLLAAVLARWSARRAARSTVLVLASAVAANLALGIAAFCPTPDIGRWSMLIATPSSDEKIADLDRGDAELTDHDKPAVGISIASAWRLLNGLSSPPPQSPVWQQSGTIVAMLYGVGVAIAGLRLLSSWLAVRSLRLSSRPIHDAALLRLADALRDAPRLFPARRTARMPRTGLGSHGRLVAAGHLATAGMA